MDAPTIGRPMGARCATYTLHRVSAQHLLSHRHPESRVYSLRARENPFTQPSPSFRGVTPTVCGLRARTCVHAVGCTCVRTRLPSLARSFVHPSDGDVRANLDVAWRFCFIRESSSSFVRTRASPSSRSRRLSVVLSLFLFRRERERRRVRKDNSNVPSAWQGSSPRPCPSSSGASTHPTHLGRSHTSLRLSRRIAKKREGEPNEHAPVTVHYRFCTPPPSHHPLFPSFFFCLRENVHRRAASTLRGTHFATRPTRVSLKFLEFINSPS